ncbi:MAG: helix-turn-helix domain-containing protein [Chitinophagaceae bacterium]|nr:helix-turn-helix domain-containing protein [Chitinophagaceae bacterium]
MAKVNFSDTERVVLTIDDLVEYTGWSKSYIYKKTSDGTLKYSKPLGKTIFFSKEWIDNFLLSASNRPIAETEAEANKTVHLKNLQL